MLLAGERRLGTALVRSLPGRIVPKNGASIGQRTALSDGDIQVCPHHWHVCIPPQPRTRVQPPHAHVLDACVRCRQTANFEFSKCYSAYSGSLASSGYN